MNLFTRCLLVAAAALAGNAAVSAPGKADEDRLRFAVMGHLRGNENGELNPWMDEIVESVAAEEPQALFLTGDMIWAEYHAERVDRKAVAQDWDMLEAALRPIGAPLHIVPGNHDINDPVTAALFHERFGPRPAAVRIGSSLFLLLDSTLYDDTVPTPSPRTYTRTDLLPAEQAEWIRQTLAEHEDARHVFVFMHHVLWWEDDAAWWTDIHPILARHPVRAVFAGDFGPLKFSHTERDGIQYIQSAIEGFSHVQTARNFESTRVMNYQFENFVVVDVEGDSVEFHVRTAAALATGKQSPERHHQIFAREVLTLSDKLERALGGPTRRTLLAGAALLCVLIGVVVGRISGRR
ncbi:MAG: metallophosphoesterase [Deltaproteobacteria bacterium]|nr:metallophosphoesterase [Deltaproteobacteria bacterium]